LERDRLDERGFIDDAGKNRTWESARGGEMVYPVIQQRIVEKIWQSGKSTFFISDFGCTMWETSIASFARPPGEPCHTRAMKPVAVE